MNKKIKLEVTVNKEEFTRALDYIHSAKNTIETPSQTGPALELDRAEPGQKNYILTIKSDHDQGHGTVTMLVEFLKEVYKLE